MPETNRMRTVKSIASFVIVGANMSEVQTYLSWALGHCVEDDR